MTYKVEPITSTSSLHILQVDLMCHEISLLQEDIAKLVLNKEHHGCIAFLHGVPKAYAIYKITDKSINIIRLAALRQPSGILGLTYLLDSLITAPTTRIRVVLPEYDGHEGGANLSWDLMEYGFKLKGLSVDAFDAYGEKWDGLRYEYTR